MIKYLDFQSKREFSRTQIVPALLENCLYDKAKKLIGCGVYSNLAICQDCNSAHYAGSIVCKDKFCPVCQKKRSLLWLTKLIPICRELLDRGYHLNMLTYTIRTNKDMSLTECLDILNAGFRYMTHENKNYRKLYNDLIIGGVKSLEVKIGEDKETKDSTDIWHPHYHILVCTRNEHSYKELHKLLYDMWNSSLNTIKHTNGLDLGGVHISSIKAKDNQSMLDALSECFKYMTKFDWQSDKVVELVTSMHKVKMQNTFGNFRYLISDKNIEYEMNKSTQEVITSFCAVCGGNDFVEVQTKTNNKLQLYDLQHQYSDLKTEDLILNDI